MTALEKSEIEYVIFSLKTKITTALILETVDFYKNIFGMVVVEEWDEVDDRGVILALPDGTNEALLEIYYGEGLMDFSSISLQFKTDELASFLKQLPESIDRNGPTPRPWGATYLYLRDPNDILIIVYEACM
jgi:catechol 2,3-dioxygenase-like lactoylglutathione lyase family enzyme